MAKEVKTRAKKSGMTQSEFFRTIVRHFLAEEEWQEIFKLSEKQAEKEGILQSDAYNIVSKMRHEGSV